MGMIKKISKTGTSYAVILDKSIMQLLSIDPDSLIEMTTDGKSIILTPVTDLSKLDGVNDPKFQKAMDETFDQYDEAFKNLAK